MKTIQDVLRFLVVGPLIAAVATYYGIVSVPDLWREIRGSR